MNEPNERPDGQRAGEMLDPVVAAAAQALRQPVRLAASQSLDDRVMAAIIAEPPAWTRGGAADALPEELAAAPLRVERGGAAGAAWRWLSRPRTVHLSPLAGLAAAAGIAIVVLAGSARGPRDAAPANATTVAVADSAVPGPGARVAGPAPVAESAAPQVVQFVFVAPEARSVALVGDFNDWDTAATPLRAASGQVWTVEVPLEPGRHRYAFVVDGEEWAADPAAPRAPGADFGAPSSVVTVVNRRS